MYRPTYLKIDCDQFKKNIKEILKYNSDYKYFIGVVKNNCYHHGIYLVRLLSKLGINYFAVSSLEEAIEVRKYDDKTPILCLEPIGSEYVYDAINDNVSITIDSYEEALEISNLKISDTLKIHLKIDSGMNRIGFKDKDDLKKTYELLTSLKNVMVEGVYTHFATDGVKDKYYNYQVDNFEEITSLIPLKDIPIVHVDRSFTSLIHSKHHFANGFRIGLSMYGYLPEKLKSDLNLGYVAYLYSQVISLRKVTKGEFVGYNASFKLKHDSIIATIPIGYADGVSKDFKYVYINDRRYNIVAECMDMIMVEVDDNVAIGDEVEIFGKNQSVVEVAKRVKLIDHKFINLISNRVPVVYFEGKNRFEVKY